jgi:hypothetical protein
MDKFLDFFTKLFIFSQIHRWICVTFQSTLKYELGNVFFKFQHHPSFNKGVTLVKNSKGCTIVFSEHY